MQIIVLADGIGKEEFKAKSINPEIQTIFVKDLSEILDFQSADAFFILKEINKNSLSGLPDKPVIIDSVLHTLKDLDLPENFIRINGWHTFLQRDIWEVATTHESIVKDIFKKLEWKYILVADEAGLVSARIIAMIVNEAYFALGENVSTKEEIDLAMKLGTNYPYGPFEWCEKIGIKYVYSLLEKLSKTDSRYNVAPALKSELSKN